MQKKRNTRTRFLSAVFLACVIWQGLAEAKIRRSAPAVSWPDVSAPGRIEVKAGDLRMVLETVRQGIRLVSLTDLAMNQELSPADHRHCSR